MYCAGEPMLGHLSRSFLSPTVASCTTRKLCQPYTGLCVPTGLLGLIAQKSCDRDEGGTHFTIAIMCIQRCHSTDQGPVEQNGQVVALPQTLGLQFQASLMPLSPSRKQGCQFLAGH